MPKRKPPTRPCRQDHDSLCKSILTNATSILEVMEPGCQFVALMPTSTREATIEQYTDFLAEILLPDRTGKWRYIHSSVEKIIMHVEVAHELESDYPARLRIYRTRITNDSDEVVLVIQHVLVVGHVPKRGRVRRIDVGTDRRGRREYVYVHYLDEIKASDLSEADRNSAWGKILAMIEDNGQTDEITDDAVVIVVSERNPAQRQKLREAVQSVSNIWTHMSTRIREATQEAIMQILSPARRERIIRENAIAFNETPENRAVLESEYLKPEFARGQEVGLEKGTRAAHVAALLRILKWNKVKLARRYVQRLKETSCEELPDLDVAHHAKSAKDFVRAAKLDD